MQELVIYKALANDKRLAILEWLKSPSAHFPPQTDGDFESDGVCAVFIAQKLGISQATLSEHMRVLVSAGLVRQTKIKQWIFYRRDEDRIARLKAEILSLL